MTQRTPDVRYVTTSDGVSIACWSVGDGPPIIIAHNFALSHAELEWEIPMLRRFYSDLGVRHQVIRFDPRLAGVSGHIAPSLSLDAMCFDIDAVANVFGCEVFSLMGISVMSPAAIEYAASRPERVSYLILGDGLTSVSDSVLAETIRGSVALTTATSPAYAMGVFGKALFPDDYERQVAVKIMTAVYERMDVISAATLRWDVSTRLKEVRAPTLILFAASTITGDLDQAREIAAGIPHARFVRFDGVFAPYGVDQSAAITAIVKHLGGPSYAPHETTTLQTVVFTDLVGFTEHTNVVGDVAAREEARRIEALIGQAAADHRGRLVKHLGDGAMLVFDSPSSAVDFATELQAATEATALPLRIGMAVGEPIVEQSDLHGAVVNLAARIVAEAGPGQVLVSDGTRQLLIGKPYVFDFVGTREVKGFDYDIGLYAVVRSG